MAARLILTAALLALAAWAGGSSAAPPAKPSVTLAAGAFSQSNSRDGQAILGAAGMRPGGSAQGTVTVANTGSTSAGFTLVRSAVNSPAGPGGGRLADSLLLEVVDLTAGRLIYSGSLMGMSPPSVGRFAPGESHTFRFRVLLPDAGNAVAGSSAGIAFQWIAEHDDAPQPPRPQPGSEGSDPGSEGSDPAPPPPAPAAGGPKLTLSGPKAQRVLRQGAATVTAGCEEDCTLRATGSLGIARVRAQKRKMAPAATTLAAGQTARLRVRLSKAAKSSLRNALAQRRKVRLTVRVTATGASGKTSTRRRAIAVRR